MTSTTSYRLSGVALLIGGILTAVGYSLPPYLSDHDPSALTSPWVLISSLITLFGALLVLLGLPGIYTRQVVGYLGAVFRTSGNVLISLIATGLVVVLFQPLRGWLQRSANRLLYGQRDEPYAVITRLSQRLEATLAPDAMLFTIVETVAQALKLPYVAILLNREGTFAVAASHGKRVDSP